MSLYSEIFDVIGKCTDSGGYQKRGKTDNLCRFAAEFNTTSGGIYSVANLLYGNGQIYLFYKRTAEKSSHSG